ncbi:MAG: hypothetical protein ACC628_05460 [Pirellulaceae bacterium]
MRRFTFTAMAFLCTAAITHAAGFVHNDNFLVFTESGISPQVAQDFAGSLMMRAEAYRKQIAEDWLGRPLPAGIGRATINLRFSDSEDTGLTWAIDHPNRKTHTVYLVTSADKALGTTLAHEMVHVVLATRFPHPHRLPAWLEEGIASQYDDEKRHELRADKAHWWVETGAWPDVEEVLRSHNIQAHDQQAYTVAAFLADMLLARGDKRKLLAFGEAATRSGWRTAMEHHYRISGPSELQRAWQSRVMQSVRTSAGTVRLSQR